MGAEEQTTSGHDGLHAVFRALDDPGRRALLDALFDRDGQTLTELLEVLPEMTRYGVMNHLRVLAEANLVTSVKRGRSRFHYLNPVPIRQVHDRWITKFTEPWVGALTTLADHFAPETQGASMSDTTTLPDHRYQAYVAATPTEVWHAITDGAMTVQYFYNTIVESTWVPGEPIRYLSPDGDVVADGEVLSVDEPKRLEMTFQGHWDPVLLEEGPVRTVWLVAEDMGSTAVTVEYYGMGPATREMFTQGIPFIVSGLKSLLETGKPMG